MNYSVAVTTLALLSIGCSKDSSVNPPVVPVTPTVSITARPNIIHAGDSVVVAWISQNATRCFFNTSQEVSPTGSLVFNPIANTVYTVTAVSKDGINVSASDSVRLKPWIYTLSTSVVGPGTIVKVPDTVNYVEGSQVKLTAKPDSGAIFVGWTGSLVDVTNPTTISMTSNKAITATFRKLQYYTLAVTVVGNGKVMKVPDQPTYLEGTQVQVTETPDSTNQFLAWGGDVGGSSNSITITMNSNKTVSATFSQLPYYSLNIAVFGGGSVTKVPDAATYLVGTPVQITAVPDGGNHLGSWSGDTSANSTTLTVRMMSNKLIVANFAADQPGLVAYYPFNGNAFDESGNGHNGTVVGATLTTDRFGVNGRAYRFNYGYSSSHSGDCINIPDDPSLRLSTSFTLAAFVTFQNYSNDGKAIISKIAPADWNGGYEMRIVPIPDTTVVLSGRVNGTNTTCSAQIHAVDRWYHIAYTYDGTQLRQYINGVQVASQMISGGFETSILPLRIGGRYGDSMWFTGSIDEVRLYNRTLSDVEIQQIYHDGGY
jgi:hypothetical protein